MGCSSSVVELTASSAWLFVIPSLTVLVVSASMDSISCKNESNAVIKGLFQTELQSIIKY